LSNILEDRYDLRHKGTDVLVVFGVGPREGVGDVRDYGVIILEEEGLKKR